MSTSNTERFEELTFDQLNLDDNTYRFREILDDDALRTSLQKHGQRVPIEVMGSTPPYTVISGFSRIQALKALGHSTVKAIIGPARDRKTAQLHSLAENMSRRSLSELDQIHAVRRLKDDEGWGADEIAAAFQRDRRQIQNYLRVARDASDEMKEGIAGGKLTVTHVLALLESDGRVLAGEVMDKQLSVSEVKRLSKVRRSGPARGTPSPRGGHQFRKFKGGSFNLIIKYKKRAYSNEERRELIGQLEAALKILQGDEAMDTEEE